MAVTPISMTSRCGFGKPSNHLRASCVEDERTPLLRSSVTSSSVRSKNFAKSKTGSSESFVEELLLIPLLMLLLDSGFEVVPPLVLVAFFLPPFFFPTISLMLAVKHVFSTNKIARWISFVHPIK